MNDLEKGLSIKYKLFFNEKDMMSNPLCRSICNMKHFVFINNPQYRLFLELEKYTEINKFRIKYIDGMDYHDITDFVQEDILHKYMCIYVNIKGI